MAMCVNDLIVCGAEPRFFLDYFATGGLDVSQGRQVVSGVAEGCRQAGCALLGGETAEMPGFYPAGEYDLAGFAVGVVDKALMLGSERVRAGDALLGLASTGLHSNGFSLLRKVFELDRRLADAEQLRQWLEPTRIYVRAIEELKAAVDLHALAHITGGGLPGNLPRVLPSNLVCRITPESWPLPECFTRIAEAGRIAPEEMRKTFNMGLGMVAVLPKDEIDRARDLLAILDIPAWEIGRVTERAAGEGSFAWPLTAED